MFLNTITINVQYIVNIFPNIIYSFINKNCKFVNNLIEEMFILLFGRNIL